MLIHAEPVNNDKCMRTRRFKDRAGYGLGIFCEHFVMNAVVVSP